MCFTDTRLWLCVTILTIGIISVSRYMYGTEAVHTLVVNQFTDKEKM